MRTEKPLRAPIGRRGIRSREALFSNILNTATDAIVSVDETGHIVIFNQGAEEVFGYAPKEVLGQPLALLLPERAVAAHEHHLRNYVASHSRERRFKQRRDLTGRRKDGSEFPAEINISKTTVAGQTTFTAIVRDISERKMLEQQLDQLAHHDELTGLPNRRLLRVHLEQSMQSAMRHGHMLAVLMLDMDHFKTVNDSLGHGAGDELIRQVAARLQSNVRSIDTVARLGGDEFSILLSEIRKPEDGIRISNKLTDAFAMPFRIADHDLHIGISIGIALFPNDGATYDNLLHNADIAMFRAKDQGGSRVAFYREGLTEQAVERLALEQDLRRALGQHELLLHYQPQVVVASDQVAGVEALLRWQHPDYGDVAPDRFISLAEETGLIVPIGEWVLRTACAQARAWHEAGLALRVAVNVSPRQFQEDGLVKRVLRILQESGAEPEWLEIEISESMLLRDQQASLAALTELRQAGLSIVLDDFGTGYSSLSYLKRFPVNRLKIDRSFVSEIPANADGTAITGAIIAMGRRLGITVGAVGVETQAQWEFLRSEDCEFGQGHYLHRPMPAAEITTLFRQTPS